MPTSTAIGLVLARPPRLLGHEPFFGELIAGIEEILGAEEKSLLLHVVPDHASEIAAYHRWMAGNMVGAVVVVNLIEEDLRIAVLQELGMPAVVLGGPSTGMPFTNVWVDDAQGTRDAVAYLAGLGHRTLARVSGPHRLAHTRARSDAFSNECRKWSTDCTIIEGDYTEEKGRHAARSLLGRHEAPTAIIFDNDIMALAALSVAGEMHVRVPEQLSLLAWDDSAMCRLASPTLSAMVIDVHGMGQLVGTCVLNTLAGGPVRSYAGPMPRLTARGSTGAPTLARPTAAPAPNGSPEVTTQSPEA